MSGCCPSKETSIEPSKPGPKKRPSLMLYGSLFFIFVAFVVHYSGINIDPKLSKVFSDTVELMNHMWVGLGFAVIFVGILDKIPRELVMGVLGTKKGLHGLLRATLAGLLLDLCNHGILLVGMKLYKKGASLGQMMAFLIASPWNSFSMTLILISLIGWEYTLLFVLLSAAIAILSGLIFDYLEKVKILPENPNRIEFNESTSLMGEFKTLIKSADYKPRNLIDLIFNGFKSSKPILKWIFFGVVLAVGLRTVLDAENFETYLGPTFLGLTITLIGATIIEVCSEGSAPIAGDLFTIAKAPGNSFTFLMAGVSTDYTEIMSIKETTGSWKISLFLPLITLPQILVLGYLLNIYS